jgi:4-amino-4-deoxy-L-arabinose transferase-like glycosyltransferase
MGHGQAAESKRSDAAPRLAVERMAAWSTPEALHRVLVGVSLGAIVYLFANILMFRYGRDQGIYATVADEILRGGMPYRDAWDFKPPGIYVVYAATRAIFGSAQWAIRLVEVAGLASTVWAFVILARRFFSDWRIGIVGGALAVLVHAELEFWHTAQPESFGGMVTAWAIVLATFEPREGDPAARRKRFGAWALAGALYGFAFLLKPPLGGGAPISAAFAAYAMRREIDGRPLFERLRALSVPFLAMAAGSALVVAGCALWFVARGAHRELYDTLFVFTPHYTKLGWEDATVPGMVYLAVEEWFIDLSSINAAGFLAAFILPRLASREGEAVLHLLLVIAVQLVGVAMQGKFFPYHYGASVLLGSLIAGLGAFKVWQRAVAKRPWGVVAFATVLPVLVQARSATRNTQTDFLDRCLARQRLLLGASDMTRDELDGKLYSVADVSYDADRRVAEFLRRALAPDERAFIWGFEPMIYDMAERRPASRFIYDVPQRVAWFKDQARAGLMMDLDRMPPKAIVVEHRDVFPAVTGDAIDSADTLKRFPALESRIRERYDLATTIEDFDVYLLR